jgi:hypothetical protein
MTISIDYYLHTNKDGMHLCTTHCTLIESTEESIAYISSPFVVATIPAVARSYVSREITRLYIHLNLY